MRNWIAVLGLLSIAVATAAGEVNVRLSDVPRQVRLPLPEGENAILTARVDGKVRSLWLARSRDARARYLLDRVGEGVYQVNLADTVLAAMLEASGAGQVCVFAEAPDGTVSASIPVSYAVRTSAREWHRPPRVFVHTEEKTTELSWWGRAWEPDRFALLAEIRGQGMAITAPDLSRLSFGPGGKDIIGWFEPSEVKLIEVRFDPGANRTSARAGAGERQWEFARADSGEARQELAVTTPVRRAWEQAGELAITCAQQGMDDLRIVLRMPPRKLDLPKAEAQFTIVQRHTQTVPGSDGYLLLRIGDITGGQTLLTLRSAAGRELVQRKSVQQGDSVRFRLGKNEYELTLKKLVNFLVGDDYAQFVVAPYTGRETARKAEATAPKPPKAAPAAKP